MIRALNHGLIQYTGAGETMTVLQFHLRLQELGERLWSPGEEIDITSPLSSIRMTDHYIIIQAPYWVSPVLELCLTDGCLVQELNGRMWSSVETHWPDPPHRAKCEPPRRAGKR